MAVLPIAAIISGDAPHYKADFHRIDKYERQTPRPETMRGPMAGAHASHLDCFLSRVARQLLAVLRCGWVVDRALLGKAGI